MTGYHQLINTFSREISSFYDAKFKEAGLATSYAELLILVKESEKISQKQIAISMNLAPSTITRFIAKLEKKGLVSKERRGKEIFIELTEKGKKLTVELEQIYNQAEEELQAILGSKFIETTGKLFEFGAGLMND
jgi:DNA-binding MarR family transcriptional regulator